ncbi:hypothetical protein ACHAWF_004883 [Thalassiosira exigua]
MSFHFSPSGRGGGGGGGGGGGAPPSSGINPADPTSPQLSVGCSVGGGSATADDRDALASLLADDDNEYGDESPPRNSPPRPPDLGDGGEGDVAGAMPAATAASASAMAIAAAAAGLPSRPGPGPPSPLRSTKLAVPVGATSSAAATAVAGISPQQAAAIAAAAAVAVPPPFAAGKLPPPAHPHAPPYAHVPRIPSPHRASHVHKHNPPHPNPPPQFTAPGKRGRPSGHDPAMAGVVAAARKPPSPSKTGKASKAIKAAARPRGSPKGSPRGSPAAASKPPPAASLPAAATGGAAASSRKSPPEQLAAGPPGRKMPPQAATALCKKSGKSSRPPAKPAAAKAPPSGAAYVALAAAPSAVPPDPSASPSDADADVGPILDPKVAPAVHSIIHLLQIYGPLSYEQLRFNMVPQLVPIGGPSLGSLGSTPLPPLKAGQRPPDLSGRARVGRGKDTLRKPHRVDFRPLKVLDIMQELGVIHLVDKDKLAERGRAWSSSGGGGGKEGADLTKPPAPAIPDVEDPNPIYCFGDGKPRMDVVLPSRILEEIRLAGEEVLRARERIGILRGALLAAMGEGGKAEREGTTATTTVSTNRTAETTPGKPLPEGRARGREAKNEGLTPQHALTTLQRILELHPEVVRDPVYAAALRMFRVPGAPRLERARKGGAGAAASGGTGIVATEENSAEMEAVIRASNLSFDRRSSDGSSGLGGVSGGKMALKRASGSSLGSSEGVEGGGAGGGSGGKKKRKKGRPPKNSSGGSLKSSSALAAATVENLKIIFERLFFGKQMCGASA